jgi:hypothetical protein
MRKSHGDELKDIAGLHAHTQHKHYRLGCGACGAMTNSITAYVSKAHHGVYPCIQPMASFVQHRNSTDTAVMLLAPHCDCGTPTRQSLCRAALWAGQRCSLLHRWVRMAALAWRACLVTTTTTTGAGTRAAALGGRTPGHRLVAGGSVWVHDITSASDLQHMQRPPAQ